MSSSIICGPCNRVNRNNSAQILCTNCGEGFCADCEQTHRSMLVTADHTLISTNTVHKTENSAVIMICDIHGKTFDQYCKTHDLAISVACLPAKHKHCSGAVISLIEAAKRSIALDDITDSVNVALDNKNHFIKNRNVAMQNVEVQEQSIQKSIGEMRTNLNKHLDKIEN
ncbi:protein wech-like [Mytilus edulis]|uniref:protein wech-like n=1 Tax=Mytilus edulis TaxID=6550 RepID=UPI0039F136B1